VIESVIESVIVIENAGKTATETGIEKENASGNAKGNAIAVERGNATEKGNVTGKEKGTVQFLLHCPHRPQRNVLFGGNWSISFIVLLFLTSVVVQANGIGTS
jgi:hypothetical protein